MTYFNIFVIVGAFFIGNYALAIKFRKKVLYLLWVQVHRNKFETYKINEMKKSSVIAN